MARPFTESCFKLKDSSSHRESAKFLSASSDPRQALAIELRLGRQLIEQNRRVFDAFGVVATCQDRQDGTGAYLCFDTHDTVGAFPLKSPTSGRWDYGVVIEPRQGWNQFGGILSTMGWKVVPELQRLHPLPLSAREIPSWVLGSVLIGRIEKLLQDMARQFEFQHEILSAPRGRIDWAEYIAKQLPRMGLLNLPCDFSELSDHRVLMGVLHFTVKRIYAELQSVTDGGVITSSLLQRAHSLLLRVSQYPIVRPTPQMFEPVFYGKKLASDVFSEGLEAVQWTAENRGLAGLSDFRGLPWKMSISAFFEAFVETVIKRAMLYLGGSFRVGRLNETVIPISWEHVRWGTQKSLRPDFVIEHNGEVVIVDAKFKSYWYDMTMHRWQHTDVLTQEEHRADLLQVLAYSTCYSSAKLTVCLVYPCEGGLYDSFCEKNCLERRASVYSGTRKINIILTAVPMRGNIDKVAERFSNSIMSHVAE